jgi:hypothetical protein
MKTTCHLSVEDYLTVALFCVENEAPPIPDDTLELDAAALLDVPVHRAQDLHLSSQQVYMLLGQSALFKVTASRDPFMVTCLKSQFLC